MQRESSAPGPLRNGNPRGNPNLAPRCGARTRAGCACRAPAMKNGRCRMHGGASTGARTAEGLARIRAARTRHGGYRAEMRAMLRQQVAFIRETRLALALLNRGDEAAAMRVLRVAVPGPVVRSGGNSPCNVGASADE